MDQERIAEKLFGIMKKVPCWPVLAIVEMANLKEPLLERIIPRYL